MERSTCIVHPVLLLLRACVGVSSACASNLSVITQPAFLLNQRQLLANGKAHAKEQKMVTCQQDGVRGAEKEPNSVTRHNKPRVSPIVQPTSLARFIHVRLINLQTEYTITITTI